MRGRRASRRWRCSRRWRSGRGSGGPLGLLLATPLTVCVVVLGKHVPGLEFVGMLMADTPALAPEYGYYQRLLARDQSEAADLIERHIRTQPPRSVYDALLLPALNYAERDRLEQRLSLDEETAVIEATRELLADAAESIRSLQPEPPAPREESAGVPDHVNRCACSATRSTASPTSSRSRCSPMPWTTCRSSSRQRIRACRHQSSCRWSRRRASPSSASPICHPARRRRRAIWSSGSTPPCLTCGSSWDAGARRRSPTRARRSLRDAGADARRLDARGDPGVLGRSGGDPASPSDDHERACRVAASRWGRRQRRRALGRPPCRDARQANAHRREGDGRTPACARTHRLPNPCRQRCGGPN